MKASFLLCCALLASLAGLQALSIYDIQYTSSRGVDNSFPSPYLGKAVSIEGIVTAVNSNGSGFYLSETVSGAWRGIFINDTDYRPALGTLIRVSGEVGEYFGMTCLRNLSAYKVVDYNRSLPSPIVITTSQLTNPLDAEAYEGVRVRVVNASSANSKVRNNKFLINDGSGQCSVNLGSFNLGGVSSVATQFSQISGIVVFSHGEYSLNPVNGTDLQTQQPVSTQNRSWGKIKSIYK